MFTSLLMATRLPGRMMQQVDLDPVTGAGAGLNVNQTQIIIQLTLKLT